MNRLITRYFGKLFGLSLKPLLICFYCLFSLSCSSDHESEIQIIFETEFEKNYRAISNLENIKQSYTSRLEKLKKHNSDAYRSIAFTWHTAAFESCKAASPSPSRTAPASGYQLLLDKDHQQSSLSYQTNEKTRACITQFYLDNWIRINAMIKLNI